MKQATLKKIKNLKLLTYLIKVNTAVDGVLILVLPMSLVPTGKIQKKHLTKAQVI